MSPAPIVSSTSPGPSRSASALAASSASGSHQTGLPPALSAAASATARPLTPASAPTGSSRAGIDVEHGDLVRRGERGPELRGEGLGAGVEVGLEDGDQPPRGELPGRLERRPDLGRVVGVVVVDPRAGALALELKPPRDAAEPAEGLRGRLRVEPRQGQRRQRSQRVGDVVASRNRKRDLRVEAGAASPEADAAVRASLDPLGDEVCRRRRALPRRRLEREAKLATVRAGRQLDTRVEREATRGLGERGERLTELAPATSSASGGRARGS